MIDTPQEIQRYLNQSLDDLMQQFDLYAEEASGVQRGPGEAWSKIVPALKQKICVEGNWCEQRQDARFDDPLNIALALAAMINDETIRLLAPATLIAAILVKRGIDAFCGCAPLGAKKEN
ncbi:hypothetical protein TFLX_00467 [Thermoflexales bacterium]|nr:hypothetical protein TFLX_00467 [Thermoflexales bacterium]